MRLSGSADRCFTRQELCSAERDRISTRDSRCVYSSGYMSSTKERRVTVTSGDRDTVTWALLREREKQCFYFPVEIE